MREEMKRTFLENHRLTYDLLKSLDEKQMNLKWERPGLDTFDKQFQELICVQDAFTAAIISRGMSFDTVPGVFEFGEIREQKELINLMEAADRRLYQAIDEADPGLTVDWYGLKLSLYGHISNLVQHEVFHQGMMAMALYRNGIALPDSWLENWELPQAGQR